ncbi:MAG: zinc ribbon domain-containing protein [Anaerolineales bacterium]|nr:zinc ribbon domain-containing protein [Anaerolineales bacterium]
MQNPTLACPHCGAQISANAQFCKSCGKPIVADQSLAPRQVIPPAERKCPHCDAAISSTAQFCRACGKAIGPSQPPLPSSLPAPSVSPPMPTKKRGGCGRPLACGCLAALFLCVLAGVGGYLAYQNDLITLGTVLRLIGRAPAVVTVYNFADNTIYVTFSELDPDGSTSEQKAVRLTSLALESRSYSQPGRYKYQFGSRDGGADLGTCTVTLRYNDEYQFVPLPGMIVVNRLNQPSATFSDLLVESSSLCR